MSLNRPRLTLNCERLEDRTTPTTYTVKVLSPAAGIPGETTATVTADVHTGANLPTDAAGAALVTANSPLEAVRAALWGYAYVDTTLRPYFYSLDGGSPNTIGASPADHLPFYFDGYRLWLEDMAGDDGGPGAELPPIGGGDGGSRCDWDYNDHKWFVEVAEHISADESTVGDLDIIDSTGAAVSEDKETAIGGWVPLNNDNDNYNFPNATSLAHTLDLSEQAQVVGEDDLVKLKVTLPANAIGWTLTFEESGVRVWKEADKQTRYTSGANMATNVTELWVEGTVADARPRQHLLLLRTQTQTGNNPPVTNAADRVNVTVYDVQGAMNVPGYSKHTYRAAVPDGTPRFAATGEHVVNVTADNPVPGTADPRTSTTARILWDAGAGAVGTYKVYPTADDNFFATRQVNVVKVEFSAQAAGDNQLIYENNERAPKQDPSDPRVIHSSLTHDPPPPGSPPGTPPVKKAEPAMRAFLKISRIEGPTVGGGMRGVRFIEAGLIQNVTVTAQHGVYNGFAQPRKRVLSMEGQSYLDALTETSPWYLPSSYLPQLQPATLLGVYAHGSDPAAALTNVATLKINDTPIQPATDTMVLTVSGQSDAVDEFHLRGDFKLYFAVRTLEAILGSEKIFTQRGLADWHFDGTAGVVAGVWQKGAANNDGSGSLGEVTNGSVVPLTDPTKTAGRAAMTATWSTV